MKIAICDDTKWERERAAELINAYSGFDRPVNVEVFSSGTDLLKVAIDDKKKFDIVFMDIQLGDEEMGHDIGVDLKDAYPQALIIYMSSFRGYEHAISNAEPLMFLHKPLSQEEVNKALDRAMKRISMLSRKYYNYIYKGKVDKVDLLEVVCLESYLRHIRVITKDKKAIKLAGRNGVTTEEIYNEFQQIHPVFCQTHASRYINALHIDVINKTSFVINGEPLKVGSDYIEECRSRARELILEYKR